MEKITGNVKEIYSRINIDDITIVDVELKTGTKFHATSSEELSTSWMVVSFDYTKLEGINEITVQVEQDDNGDYVYYEPNWTIVDSSLKAVIKRSIAWDLDYALAHEDQTELPQRWEG